MTAVLFAMPALVAGMTKDRTDFARGDQQSGTGSSEKRTISTVSDPRA
jgi:hypothetical protein